MTEKLKLEFTNEKGDRISWTSDSQGSLGFLAVEYWRVCAEFYETLGYKNAVGIEIGHAVGTKTTVNFTKELGVH